MNHAYRLELEASICRDSLAEFFKRAWPILEPNVQLKWNWHLQAICDHVQALLQHRIAKNKLIVNVPPRSAKSTIVSVCAHTWVWTWNPTWRAIFASGNEKVLNRDSLLSRKVMASDWYRNTFKPSWTFSRRQDGVELYANTAGGSRRSVTTGARITGEGGEATFIDDPIDAQYANSEAHRLACLEWHDQAYSTRLNDPATGTCCLIMQRLHDQDLSGHLLATGLWEHLEIPQEFEPQRRKTTCLGWTDPRTVEGELMFPERFPEHWLAAQRIGLGTRGYAGQHQQRPTPLEGGIIKRAWLKYYSTDPLELVKSMDQALQSWDFTFKETDGSDYVVGQVWGRKGANKYLLDQVRAKMEFPAMLAAVRALSKKWPRAYAKLVEDKANGPAVISSLKDELSGLIPVEPQGSKDARLHSCSPEYEAGNVFLPENAPWLNDHVEELVAFSGEGSTVHDDQIDASTQALIRFRQHPTGLDDFYAEAAAANQEKK